MSILVVLAYKLSAISSKFYVAKQNLNAGTCVVVAWDTRHTLDV